MKTITASELQNKTGSFIDEALINPIEITRNNRSAVVLNSVEEYER